MDCQLLDCFPVANEDTTLKAFLLTNITFEKILYIFFICVHLCMKEISSVENSPLN